MILPNRTQSPKPINPAWFCLCEYSHKLICVRSFVCAHDSTAPADCTFSLSSTSSCSPRRRPVLSLRLHANTHTADGAHTKTYRCASFCAHGDRGCRHSAGPAGCRTCPSRRTSRPYLPPQHTRHSTHAIQATCFSESQLQATPASLNLTYPSHAVARGSSGSSACGGAVLDKC